MQRATFHSLYEAHARDVFRFARYPTGDAGAAADVTSETFLRAWAGRDAVRAELRLELDRALGAVDALPLDPRPRAGFDWSFWSVAVASWVAFAIMNRRVRSAGL